MAERCPNASYLGNTMLKDWRLIFKSVATIEKDLGKYVPVGVFQITEECEKALDIYEDFPILYKKYFFLYYGKKVMTYTMTKKTPFRFPTERYLNVVKRGYNDCKLDFTYLKKALSK